MEHRDILMNEIEQFGRVLGAVLADLLGLKSKGQVSKGLKIAHQQLISQLDLDIDQLMSLTQKELKDFIGARKYSEVQVEMLADYLLEVAMLKAGQQCAGVKPYLQKSLDLYQLADATSRTASLQRLDKIKKIHEMYKKYN